MQRLERRLTAALEAVLAAGLLGILLVIIVLVAMRYAFESGLVGANEAATVVFIYVSSIGAAVAVGRQEHISVDLLSRKLGPQGAKALQVMSIALVGLLNAVVAACCAKWMLSTGYTPMPATQIPRYLAQLSIPLGCGIAVLYSCARLASVLRKEPAA